MHLIGRGFIYIVRRDADNHGALGKFDMIYVLLLAILIGAVVGPHLWARSTLRAHAADRPDLPGTGGELARHLLDRYGLTEVSVELSEHGDHYDPSANAVRLVRENHDGRSVTAVAVAAHEVGHAIQHRDGYAPLMARQRLVRAAAVTDKVGSAVLFGLSVVGSFALSPRMLLLGGIAVVLMGLVSVIVHLVTLPVEFDASFKKALPVLDRGGYLPPRDLPAARRILSACALTYVASALIGMVNFLRYFRYLR